MGYDGYDAGIDAPLLFRAVRDIEKKSRTKAFVCSIQAKEVGAKRNYVCIQDAVTGDCRRAWICTAFCAVAGRFHPWIKKEETERGCRK